MNEGATITKDQLTENWNRIFGFYESLVKQGSSLKPIKHLVQHIIKQGHSTKLYGGTSLYSLLISIPVDGRINYTKTLHVSYEQMIQVVTFTYHNKPRNLRTEENRDWSVECQATEAIDTFEHFLNEHKDWKMVLAK